MSECEGITELYKSKFVQVYLVDEIIELTVENNVYSLSESLDLIKELRSVESLLLKKRGQKEEEFEHKRYAMQPTKTPKKEW